MKIVRINFLNFPSDYAVCAKFIIRLGIFLWQKVLKIVKIVDISHDSSYDK